MKWGKHNLEFRDGGILTIYLENEVVDRYAEVLLYFQKNDDGRLQLVSLGTLKSVQYDLTKDKHVPDADLEKWK